MSDEEKNIIADINEIKLQLQNMEDTDYAYMNDEMKKLQHFTLYTHEKVETFIDHIMTADLLMGIPYVLDALNAAKVFWKMSDIFDSADFSRKLKLAKSKGLLPDGFESLAFAVNNYRMIFAHPKSHQKELNNLKEPKQKLVAYKILKSAFDSLNKHAQKMREEGQRHTNEIVEERVSEIMARINTEGKENLEKIIKEETEKPFHH